MISIAFFFHFHQPYYADDVGGGILLPWVRMHSCKDYLGMGLLLQKFPEIKATFNFVPCLLKQIVEKDRITKEDEYYKVSHKAADTLTEGEKNFIARNFFSCPKTTMIDPYPRYRELRELCLDPIAMKPGACDKLDEDDLRDLQTWFNLTWFHPLVIAGEPELAKLQKKGGDFSEGEKHFVLGKHLEMMERVIPLYRELCARGQVELTFTPFYHPIMPLLCDFTSVKEALPRAQLPKGHRSLIDDARRQIQSGIEYFEKVFGHRPKGCWPSEGSVSQKAAEVFAEQGVKWIATDEQILERSIEAKLERDEKRRLRNPDVLCRPYRLKTQGDAPAIIFRDLTISDKVGFNYKTLPPEVAAEDFIQTALTAKERSKQKSPLMPVILDGENPWEWYQGGGVPFLTELYSRLTKLQGEISTVRISDFIEANPPEQIIPRLFAGSWINHNFYIWAGHEEDRRAWEELFAARKALESKADDPAIPRENVSRAWEELYIAEGSDWCWWYGTDHSSSHDLEFDRLFRTHLVNIYDLVGEPHPAALDMPMTKSGASGEEFSPPGQRLDIVVDGKASSYFEWLGAGRYKPTRRGSVMTLGFDLVREVLFGLTNKDDLAIRIDPREGGAILTSDADTCKIHVIEPVKREIVLRNGATPDRAIWAHGNVLEAVIELQRQETRRVSFYIELMRENESAIRLPFEGAISFDPPGDDLSNGDFVI
ncbi:MAG: glycoside hydrolase family 57 protein [Planctomycetes bacterium]|nr:glycoside hydrolase family 57 protein [Planctomycetota bacterium]